MALVPSKVNFHKKENLPEHRPVLSVRCQNRSSFMLMTIYLHRDANVFGERTSQTGSAAFPVHNPQCEDNLYTRFLASDMRYNNMSLPRGAHTHIDSLSGVRSRNHGWPLISNKLLLFCLYYIVVNVNI